MSNITAQNFVQMLAYTGKVGNLILRQCATMTPLMSVHFNMLMFHCKSTFSCRPFWRAMGCRRMLWDQSL